MKATTINHFVAAKVKGLGNVFMVAAGRVSRDRVHWRANSPAGGNDLYRSTRTKLTGPQ